MTSISVAVRVRSRPPWALVVVLASLAAGPASAQDERWHKEPITALPAGAVLDDFAFHEGVGYVAARAPDGSGLVVRVLFPDDAGPSFEDTGFTGFSYLFPFLVSSSGSHVAVTTEFQAVAVLDVAAGAWDTTTYSVPTAAGSALLLEADTAGGARFLARPQVPGGPTQEILFYGAGGWVGHDLNDQDVVHVALLSSPWAAAVVADGHLLVARDVAGLAAGASWESLGDVLPDNLTANPEDGSAARIDDGSMAAVVAGNAGAWALYVTGLDGEVVTFADCSEDVAGVAPSGFRRVASVGGVLYALDRDGQVHRIEQPESCDSWASGDVSDPLFSSAVGMGAVSDEIWVAVGHDATDDTPIVAWRNRPPMLDAVPDVSVDEESTTTLTVSASDPDPTDLDELSVTGSCEGALLTITAQALDVTLTAEPSAARCVSGHTSVRCSLEVSDGDQSAEQTFTVEIRDVDGRAPVTPPSLAVGGDIERTVPIGVAGVQETLELQVDDECPDRSSITWDLSELPEVLRSAGVTVVSESDDGTHTLPLTAPLADAFALDGVEATVVATLGTADAVPPTEARFHLRFAHDEALLEGVAIDVSLSAPSLRALAAGDVVRVDGTLSSTLPTALPSLQVTLANGELAALDGSFEAATSGCGASGRAQRVESGLVVEADGVRDGCPLSFHFLARKGLAREPLRVVDCTWGPSAEELAGCGGALTLARPRALGCAQLTPSSWAALGALLTLVALGRRRRR